MMSEEPTVRIYAGYDKEKELTFIGAIFLTAKQLGLILESETGYGWTEEQITTLWQKTKKKLLKQPKLMDQLPEDIAKIIKSKFDARTSLNSN